MENTGLSHGKARQKSLFRRLRDERGQISILIGSMMLTFLLFFTVVINIGMLVNAKINLQNAADMAAYAGAAVQARQLTNISYLNYELRRQYKKFIFKYYVMGNLAQHSHPKNKGVPGARNWSPNGVPEDGTNALVTVSPPPPDGDSKTVQQFGVPITCINFNTNGDNSCMVSRVNGIKESKADVMDQINTVLAQQLHAIEAIREANCGAISSVNTQVMSYWLYNTDPEMKQLPGLLPSGGGATQLTAIKALARGMGLVPRAFLINKRIDTLGSYINEAARTGINPASAGQMISQGDAAASERTYAAFTSAFKSLGNHTFDNEDLIVMDEILPKNAANGGTDLGYGVPRLLKLDSIQVNFDVFVQQMGLGGCSPAGLIRATDPNIALLPGDPASDCVACAVAIPVKTNVVLGRHKDPSTLTYYAVRLQAPAKLMFNPFGGDLLLRAYSAAQPFGSRIGPDLSAADFVRTGTGQLGTCGDLASGPKDQQCQGQIPNLPIADAGQGVCESTGRGFGWDQNKIIYAMFQKFAPEFVPVGSLPVLNSSGILRAYHAAMVPNPCEQGKYNIPVMDVPEGQAAGSLVTVPDPYQQNFTVDQGTMAFWAPLSSKGSIDQNELKAAIHTMLQGQSQSVSNTLPTTVAQLENVLVQGLNIYLTDLKSSKGGEDGEGFNIARLTDPFNTRPDSALAQRLPISFKDSGAAELIASLTPGQAQQVKTSFVPKLDSNVTRMGRIGYSVKFVPLRALAGQGSYNPTGGTGNFANPLPTDDMDGEIQLIEH